MKTLKLDESTALRIYPTADSELKTILEESFGKEFFTPKKITDTVFNIQTLCQKLGISETELFIYPKDTTDKHKRYINACNILPKIAEIYNEGVFLDWKNDKQYKYLPYKAFSSGSSSVCFIGWYAYLSCPGEFYFKSKNLSEIAYSNFKEYYEDFWNTSS